MENIINHLNFVSKVQEFKNVKSITCHGIRT